MHSLVMSPWSRDLIVTLLVRSLTYRYLVLDSELSTCQLIKNAIYPSYLK